MNPITQLIGGVEIPPITVKIDKESLVNTYLMVLMAGTSLMVIYFVLASQIRK